MKKRRRTRLSQRDYERYAVDWNGREVPLYDERYYGIHREGDRVKVDIKRMKKLGTSGVPSRILDAASAIPRNTTYFLPAHPHRQDYAVNRFRDALGELARAWQEYKNAFLHIVTPAQTAEAVRVDLLQSGWYDSEEAAEAGIAAGARRQTTYWKLWVAQCAQFIHQMATVLDAVMLRICTDRGFSEKEITRGKLHTYLGGLSNGKKTVEEVEGYGVYAKFFAVWNMLKHNSKDLFEKLQKNYPDMLLVNRYRSGELSQYYMKIGAEYIEATLSELVPFYEALCASFFGEDPEEANWNYDEYFVRTVQETVEKF